jgi:hypothetical protein
MFQNLDQYKHYLLSSGMYIDLNQKINLHPQSEHKEQTKRNFSSKAAPLLSPLGRSAMSQKFKY